MSYEVPWSTLGKTIFLRTYSNWIPNLPADVRRRIDEDGDALRRETWDETIARVAHASLALLPHYVPHDPQTIREEQESLYEVLHRMRGHVSGRTMWTAGKDIPGEAQYNCAFHVITSPESFRDLTLLSMVGVGVGNRVTVSDGAVEWFNEEAKLHRERPELAIFVPGDGFHEQLPSQSHTSIYSDVYGGGTTEIVVGDSREGWAEAIELFFRVLREGQRYIIIDLRHVRPEITDCP